MSACWCNAMFEVPDCASMAAWPGSPSATRADRLRHEPGRPDPAPVRDTLSHLCFLLGAAAFVCPFCILSLASLMFVLGGSINAAIAPAGAILAGVFLWWAAGLRRVTAALRMRLALLAVLTLQFALSLWVGGWFYDTSHDGQVYHQETITLLNEGWNPIGTPFVVRMGPPDDLWINHYARGTELAAACMYRTTQNIEDGKAFNFLMMGASLWIGLALLLKFRKLGFPSAALLAALLAFNPVSVYQSCSYYNDGQLSSAMISLLALGAMLVLREPHRAGTPAVLLDSQPCWLTEPASGRLLLLLWAVLVVLMSGLKFTGLVYAGAATGAVFICMLAVSRSRKGARAAIILSLVAAAAMAYGTGFTGFNPYVTNTLSKGHPFYPLAGPRPIDIITTNSPEDFQGLGRAKKLALSVFSRTEDAYVAGQIRRTSLKLPFSVSEEEWDTTYATSDMRVGGWGPLFGGAILLGGCILCILIGAAPRYAAITAGVAAVVLGTALVHPETWWARYAPHVWLLPVVLALSAIQAVHRPSQVLGWVLVAVLALNAGLVGKSYAKSQIVATRTLRAQLQDLASAKRPILVHFGVMKSSRIRLSRAGVAYRETEDREFILQNGPQYVLGSTLVYCYEPLK